METREALKGFAAIRQSYVAKLGRIRWDLSQLLESPVLSEESLEELLNTVHQLGGSGATFGFPLLSRAADRFEAHLVQALASQRPQLVLPHLGEFIEAIEAVLAVAPGEIGNKAARSRPEGEKQQKTIYLLEDDVELAGFIAGELRLENYHVSLFQNVSEINATIFKSPPDALVVDIILPEGGDAGIDWVRDINSHFKPPIPAIFISQKGDFATRLRAVRSGADFYFKKPLSIEQVKYALHESIYQRPYEPYRVMLIDDDALLAQAFELDLLDHGLSVSVVNDPLKAIKEIEHFRPELILLDLYMPYCNGTELGQIIRQWPEYASIPIVFLSVERDVHKQFEAIRLAGDDFIVKPIEPWQLSIQVIARVKRARMINLYQEQLASEVAHQKLHDLLTGLPNRSYLETQIDEAIMKAKMSSGQVVALLWIDIDNFSNLNDVLGHLVGDQLIVEVAKRLASILSTSDFLCRQGGDEYAIVFSCAREEEIRAQCDKIMAHFSSPFVVEEEEIRITLSMGVSFYPDHAEEAHELIKKADIALYEAKVAGRNTYAVFEAPMERQLSRKLWVESELRQAFVKDELYLVYQPKFSVDGGRVVGAEALLRWRHPKLGEVSPGEFIPMAEKSALITDIGYWVLDACCRQINSWRQQGLEVPPIAINLSARDFANQAFIADLIAMPSTHGIDCRMLQLELTERTLAQHDSSIIETLIQLSDSGFSIAIDDFGTGYSSLKYLKRMPISLLKIDYSFIDNIPDDHDNCTITEAIIRLGKNLSVEVLAEGVETQPQAIFLQNKGCHYIQGYLYSKPLPADKFSDLISSSA